MASDKCSNACRGHDVPQRGKKWAFVVRPQFQSQGTISATEQKKPKSQLSWSPECPTSTGPTDAQHKQVVSAASRILIQPLDTVLISEDAANANKETGSPLQTEAREKYRGEEEAAAGPCWAVLGRAGLTSPWRNVNLGWRRTRRAERGFG